MNSLAFHTTQFDIVDRNGQPWIQARQIGAALGYSREDAINKIFERNADEFSAAMTCTVKLTLKGQQREIRIFSLRGAHLLAMFARTKVAKEFRRWVLDVLEGEADAPAPASRRTTKALPNGLTADQQASIKALVKARVEALPESKRAKAAITCWSALKSKFGRTYKAIEPAQFTDAISLVARLPLEGELLQAEQSKPGLALSPHEAHHLYLLMARVHTMTKECNSLAAAGLVLKSPVLDSLWEQLVEANRSFTVLDARRAEIYSNHQALGLSGGYAQPR